MLRIERGLAACKANALRGLTSLSGVLLFFLPSLYWDVYSAEIQFELLIETKLYLSFLLHVDKEGHCPVSSSSGFE